MRSGKSLKFENKKLAGSKLDGLCSACLLVGRRRGKVASVRSDLRLIDRDSMPGQIPPHTGWQFP